MLRRALVLSLILVACGGNPDSETTVDSTGGTTTAGAGSSTSDVTPTTSGASTSDTGDTGPGPAIDYSVAGPHPVGNTRFVLPAGERELLVELWYPADAGAAELAAQGHPIAEFVPAGPDRVAFDDLLTKLSPAGQIGTRLQTRSALDATPAAGGPWPVLVFSHCFDCVRFSAFSV
ncbi:MAG TPA: hypothetical protein VGB85_24080, partial [Nannocystis sp.]